MSIMFENRVVLVTGGSAGIGLATSLAFAREGASVVVADIAEEKGAKVVGEIKDLGAEAIFVKTNVADPLEVEHMVKTTVETFGRLDCACNNAGIEGQNAPTAECTEENWDKVIHINLKGVWLSMKHEIAQMLKQDSGGTIVNMSSVAGIVGFENLPAYCASKGGVNLLTKGAALEYATSKIRINAICPGAIRTEMVERVMAASPDMERTLKEMHPIGRMGMPDEVAKAVLWLCSDASSFITGQALAVDGGFVAK